MRSGTRRSARSFSSWEVAAHLRIASVELHGEAVTPVLLLPLLPGDEPPVQAPAGSSEELPGDDGEVSWEIFPEMEECCEAIEQGGKLCFRPKDFFSHFAFGDGDSDPHFGEVWVSRFLALVPEQS
eukprot:scaffold676_cov316-Pavlova_lutheri.AAC.64